jgi:hypothetical protein
MKNVRWLAALLVLLILLPGLAACGNRPGLIEGSVRPAQGGELAGQILVVAYELKKSEEVGQLDVFQKGVLLRKELIDDAGRYAFELEPGSYVVEVWQDGLEVVNRLVEVKAGRTTTVDFEVPAPSS